MDPTLPQMQSFDFDRLDPIALEDTLAYLRQHPEPPVEDIALFESYQGLLADAVGERDWMAEPFQDMGGQSSSGQLALTAKYEQTIATSSTDLSSCTSGSSGHSDPQCYPRDGINATNGSMDRRVRQDNCTWEGCQGPHVGVELGAHLEDHAHDALARWNRQSKCTWQGCKSKAVFKRSRQLKKHLHNIHTKPLLCTEPHCTHKKPFRNKHDLERHNSTRHSIERPWECPYDSCSSEIRTFARKDKWLKHIQETPHENDAFCPFHHCRLLQSQPGKIFGDRKEIGKHFREAEHAGRNTDGYTCGLGSCGIAEKQDRWILFGLWTHLLNMHKVVIYFSESQKILRGSNRTFRLQHVPADYLDKWIDCEDCASQPEAQHLLNTTTTPFKPSEIGFL